MNKRTLQAINELSDHFTLGEPAKSLENTIPLEIEKFSKSDSQKVGERAFGNLLHALKGTVEGVIESHRRACPHCDEHGCICEVAKMQVEERPLIDHIEARLVSEIVGLVTMDYPRYDLSTFDYESAIDSAMKMAEETFKLKEKE